jgi:hypothetical protein
VGRESRAVFGAAGAASTSYLGRQNATDQHRNARKGGRAYRFSKGWEVHEALTCLAPFGSNFCWPVRTLRARGGACRWRQRTPTMAAGRTDHVWALPEWLALTGVQRKWDTTVGEVVGRDY